MKILVTGGLGFIGSNFINLIFKKYKNFKLLNLDSETYAYSKEAKILFKTYENDRYESLKIDISNHKLVSSVISEFNPDHIFHFAAESHVDNSISSPREFIDTNIIGTFNLLDATQKLITNYKDSSTKFFHISTDEVFGSLDYNDTPFTEESRYKPNSPYSSSKASSDLLVRAWQKTFDLPSVITNCSNNYGPFQNDEKLIPKVIRKCMKKDKIPVYGNGSNIRDWLFVEDHCEALISLIDLEPFSGQFCIGGSNEISNLDLVKAICNEFNKSDENYDYLDLIEFVDDRPGHDFRYSIDSTKLSKTTNWRPKKNFKDGLIETINWYRGLENLSPL